MNTPVSENIDENTHTNTKKSAFKRRLEQYKKVRRTQEYTSFLIRFALGTFSISFIGIGMIQGFFEVNHWIYFGASALFYLITFAFLADLFRTEESFNRRVATLIFDISCASFNIYLTIEASNVLWLFYIWIYLGYGYRYGQTFINLAGIITFIQYNIVLLLSPNWTKMPLDSITQLVVLITIPFYISALVRKLHEARINAEKASEIKSNFLARMSHEIRTPLSGIIGLSDLLSKTQLDQQQEHFTNALNKTAKGMHGLVDDILDFSKIEAGRLEIQLKKANIIETCEEVIAALSTKAEEKKLDLSFEHDAQIPALVEADSPRLKQVLLNLVGNGIKFTHQGSVKLSLKQIDAADNLCHLEFEIKDTGIGIADAHRDNIFESFVQVGDFNTVGGTGLGMAISKQLVELMGGEIRLNSTLNHGTCINFILRLKIIQQYLPKPATSPKAKKDKAVNKPSLNCLIAEDDNVNANVLSYYLKDLGHHVVRAKDGIEAKNYLNEQTFDLVLLDMHMPHMTGGEVTQYWRQMESQKQGKKRTPMVGLTADATVENHHLCMDAGMDEFLTKPITPEKLEEIIEQYT